MQSGLFICVGEVVHPLSCAIIIDLNAVRAMSLVDNLPIYDGEPIRIQNSQLYRVLFPNTENIPNYNAFHGTYILSKPVIRESRH